MNDREPPVLLPRRQFIKYGSLVLGAVVTEGAAAWWALSNATADDHFFIGGNPSQTEDPYRLAMLLRQQINPKLDPGFYKFLASLHYLDHKTFKNRLRVRKNLTQEEYALKRDSLSTSPDITLVYHYEWGSQSPRFQHGKIDFALTPEGRFRFGQQDSAHIPHASILPLAQKVFLASGTPIDWEPYNTLTNAPNDPILGFSENNGILSKYSLSSSLMGKIEFTPIDG